jgi:hypothetical protein
VDDFSSREEPAGVLRRFEGDNAEYDEEFGRDLAWTRSPLLYSDERGNLDNQLVAHRVAPPAAAALSAPDSIRLSGGLDEAWRVGRGQSALTRTRSRRALSANAARADRSCSGR